MNKQKGKEKPEKKPEPAKSEEFKRFEEFAGKIVKVPKEEVHMPPPQHKRPED